MRTERDAHPAGAHSVIVPVYIGEIALAPRRGGLLALLKLGVGLG